MRKTWISLVIFCVFCRLNAQNSDIQKLLFAAGFENVQLLEQADTLTIFFEHREFRSPGHSIQYAQLLIKDLPGKILNWVPIYHNVPIGTYAENGVHFKALGKSQRQFYRANNEPANAYRYHLRLQPDLSARFGYYSDPFQIKFNMVLDSRIYLAPGLSLQTGLLIPVENRLDAQDMKPRLAPSMLHYFAQPWNNHFLAASIGTFYYDRYGFDLQYRYAPPAGRWSFGLETGLTGFYRLNSGSFYAETMQDLYLLGDAEYRLGFENLSLKLTAGQFLFEDKGARIDLIKQYGAVDFGLFFAGTQTGETLGFQFAFSLLPGNVYRNQKLQVRTTEEFRWEYSYNNEELVARRYRIGMPRLSDNLRQYNINFIRHL
jgi:hypothetical protein